MVKILGTGHVIRRLQSLLPKGKGARVKVGYQTNYAVYVHENLEANHPNGGQAKFLEQPARELRPQIKQQVATDLRNGLTVEQALLRAGLTLQGASQQLVPVDTGLLRASAFTEVEK